MIDFDEADEPNETRLNPSRGILIGLGIMTTLFLVVLLIILAYIP